MANRHGVRSQQSYLRVAKRRRGWRDATTMPGSSTATVESCASFGDIGRKIEGHQDIEAAFALLLARASQIRSQQQRQRGWKPFHAPASASARARPVHPLRVRRQGLHRHHQRPCPGRPVRAACHGARPASRTCSVLQEAQGALAPGECATLVSLQFGELAI